MREQTIGFLREATEEKDNATGLLYVHHWGTGFQQLIFQSDEEALAFIKNVNEKQEVA